MPATPADAKAGLLKNRDTRPRSVIFMEHTGPLSAARGGPDDPEFTVPFGRRRSESRERRDNRELFSHAHRVPQGRRAPAKRVSCEVIDLRTLVSARYGKLRQVPWQAPTGRLSPQAEWRQCQYGFRAAARICEQAVDDLDAPVERVAGRDVPMP